VCERSRVYLKFQLHCGVSHLLHSIVNCDKYSHHCTSNKHCNLVLKINSIKQFFIFFLFFLRLIFINLIFFFLNLITLQEKILNSCLIFINIIGEREEMPLFIKHKKQSLYSS
jgi:hypothetical protein